MFRPFDEKFVYYDERILSRARANFVDRLPDDNLYLISGKSTNNLAPDHFFISDVFTELKCGESTKGSYMFPMMTGQTPELLGSTPNFKEAIFAKFKTNAGYKCNPRSLMMYIYAVLYSNIYRTLFDEAIREDFVRIPYPASHEMFTRLSVIGEKLCALHLLRDKRLGLLITNFDVEGSNEIEAVWIDQAALASEEDDTIDVWINKEQYFGQVPITAWNFSIGGYYPARKWLKDRKGKTLTFDDLSKYQMIIVAINETISLMDESDDALSEFVEALS